VKMKRNRKKRRNGIEIRKGGGGEIRK